MNMNYPVDQDTEIILLRQRLAEAEELINAIRRGVVDGIIAENGQIYTLQSADYIYRVLVDTMNEGAVTLGLDGTILYANRRFSELMGEQPDGFVGKSFKDFIRDADRDGFSWLMRRGLQMPSRADFTIHTSAGKELCVLLSVSTLVPYDIAAVSVLVTDLTDQKRNEETAVVRKRLEMSQSAGRVGTFDWNLQTGLVVWTKELEELFGLPPRSFEGSYQAWAKRVHPEDLPRVEAVISDGLKTGQTFHAEYRIIWPDGSIHWIDAKGTAENDEDGRLVRCVGVNLDVTERKQLELRLARSNSELVEYAAVASHDLQAPLRTISSYLGVLEAKYASLFDDKAKRYFDYIIKSTALMGRLIRGILDYSQAGGQEAPLEVMEISEPLREAIGHLDEAIRKSQAVVEIGPMPSVRANRVNMTRLFQNLLSNAIKFCTQRPYITISATRGEHEWVLSVSDNGPGIAKSSTERIFKLFQRLASEAEVPGSGIGLATCKKIVERHGGRIWVDSTVGVGSTFSFSIPH